MLAKCLAIAIGLLGDAAWPGAIMSTSVGRDDRRRIYLRCIFTIKGQNSQAFNWSVYWLM